MKNHDKASLPKIQIKKIQVLNRIAINGKLRGSNHDGLNGMMGGLPTETVTTNTVSGIF
ncbi:hypothetical protein LX99_00052 [Mucilaginibacter oryzae]|uniref:Uncharacterized protein n=1 Tax=Mucilaginibacter oryzae TaxID=468058 RepID=A0A316HN08_9SPHI|nr:hypothetical protein [Mucilaginibacter oryzae]PWK79595.1 hypothetical protein LX99_00052 [Mucilaginibacter oryzae]